MPPHHTTRLSRSPTPVPAVPIPPLPNTAAVGGPSPLAALMTLAPQRPAPSVDVAAILAARRQHLAEGWQQRAGALGPPPAPGPSAAGPSAAAAASGAAGGEGATAAAAGAAEVGSKRPTSAEEGGGEAGGQSSKRARGAEEGGAVRTGEVDQREEGAPRGAVSAAAAAAGPSSQSGQEVEGSKVRLCAGPRASVVLLQVLCDLFKGH